MRYSELLKKIHTYEKKYQVKVIGKSLLGRNIYAVEKIASSEISTAVFVGSIHAREYISTDLLCKFLDEDLFDDINNFNISFILMANPDGVELCFDGIRSVDDEKIKNDLLLINNNNYDFSLWKANAAGIDLNNNFDANFGQNSFKTKPASQGFAGDFCESEPETRAIVDYIKSKNAFFVIAYHSKGEEIYYNFFQTDNRLKRDSLVAERFAKSTGYLIKNVENVSSGGLKDWCVQKLKIIALTIELGDDCLKHPISQNYLPQIFKKNKTVAFDLKFAYNIFKNFE